MNCCYLCCIPEVSRISLVESKLDLMKSVFFFINEFGEHIKDPLEIVMKSFFVVVKYHE